MTMGSMGWIAAEMWHYFLAAGIAIFAVGSDSALLQTALTIFQFVVSFWSLTIGFQALADAAKAAVKAGESLTWAQQVTLWIDEFGMTGRLFMVGVQTFCTMTALVSIRDDITIVESSFVVANDAGELVGGVVGDVTSGLASGLLGGLFGGSSSWLWLVGGAALIYWLASDDSSEPPAQDINLAVEV